MDNSIAEFLNRLYTCGEGSKISGLTNPTDGQAFAGEIIDVRASLGKDLKVYVLDGNTADMIVLVGSSLFENHTINIEWRK